MLKDRTRDMERRLPPPARRALHALWRTIEESDHDHRRGLSKERARRVVADAIAESGDVVSDEETTYYLEFLHDRGEIYYVDEFVRITQPDDLAPDSEGTSERE